MTRPVKSTGTDSAWTVTGVRDMKHTKKHENTRTHMDNSSSSHIGQSERLYQLDDGHRKTIRRRIKTGSL